MKRLTICALMAVAAASGIAAYLHQRASAPTESAAVLENVEALTSTGYVVIEYDKNCIYTPNEVCVPDWMSPHYNSKPC